MSVGKAILAVGGRVGSVARQHARHPLTVLEERLGEVLENDTAETASVAAPLAVALYASAVLEGSTVLLLVVWGIVFGLLATRRAPRRTDDVERDMLLAEARRAYVEGRIDEAEYERRITLLLDGRARKIRETVEEVPGVGPELSSALALRFDSVAQLEQARPEDLEEIHGVGPSTADALLAYLVDEDDDQDDGEFEEWSEQDPVDSSAEVEVWGEQDHAQDEVVTDVGTEVTSPVGHVDDDLEDEDEDAPRLSVEDLEDLDEEGSGLATTLLALDDEALEKLGFETGRS